MLKKIALMMIVVSVLSGSENKLPYYSLAQPLQETAHLLSKLEAKSLNDSDPALIKNFCEGVDGTLAVGEVLAQSAYADPELMHSYLKQLRELSAEQQKINQLYRQSLNEAMESGNKKKFEHLASLPLEPLHHPRIRSEVVSFYQKNFPEHSIKNIDLLCNEQALEAKSIQFSIEQEQAYEEHLRILKRSEANLIKKSARIGSRNSVILSSDFTSAGGVYFEAENLNPYRVTLTLDIEAMSNVAASASLPLTIELNGKSKKKILELSRLDSSRPIDYRSSYGWVRGSIFARHNDDYVYGLPFAKGSHVYVSQGYNGGTSHKGLSAYAVDFPLPIGTSVYAARDGTVVGAEGSNNIGGMGSEYRQYANYVIIEHDDGTMGNYYHLKQGGCVVKIGDKVKKGDLIAYSGNTGNTSGPHLHFSVSKVDPVSMRRPMNLPVKIQTMEGIVTNPRPGDQYTVQ